MTPADLAADLVAAAQGRRRFVVAIAGAPGSGKSTFAEALMAALRFVAPGQAGLVPMDGFHYDNAVLVKRGLLARKGAPETFDVDGLAQALERIRPADRDVAVPIFDRELDLARAGARIIRPEQRLVLVEGNYLLLDEPPWDGLAARFDRSIMLEVGEAELRRRLIARWLSYGLGEKAAEARAEGNDLANGARVIARSRRADIIWPAS